MLRLHSHLREYRKNPGELFMYWFRARGYILCKKTYAKKDPGEFFSEPLRQFCAINYATEFPENCFLGSCVKFA